MKCIYYDDGCNLLLIAARGLCASELANVSVFVCISSDNAEHIFDEKDKTNTAARPVRQKRLLGAPKKDCG